MENAEREGEAPQQMDPDNVNPQLVAPSVATVQPMPHGSDAIAIVNLVMNQMAGVEHRIKEEIARNSDAAMRRWRTHDEEHHDLAKAVKSVVEWQERHDEAKAKDRIVFDTRIGPVRSVYRFLVADKRWMIVFGYIGLQATEQMVQWLHAIGLLD